MIHEMIVPTPLPATEGAPQQSHGVPGSSRVFIADAGTLVHVNGAPFYLAGSAMLLGNTTPSANVVVPRDAVSPEEVAAMMEACGGKMETMQLFPDGHGCATASFPLPADHWLTQPGDNEPPTPYSIEHAVTPEAMREAVCAAAKYAIRASTSNGTIIDFDPDAMVQNFVSALCGPGSVARAEGA